MKNNIKFLINIFFLCSLTNNYAATTYQFDCSVGSPGQIISEMAIYHGDVIDGLSVKCSDGRTINMGGTTGTPFYLNSRLSPQSEPKGFSGMTVWSQGESVTALNVVNFNGEPVSLSPLGKGGGTARNLACPVGQKISGLQVKAGLLVDQIVEITCAEPLESINQRMQAKKKAEDDAREANKVATEKAKYESGNEAGDTCQKYNGQEQSSCYTIKVSAYDNCIPNANTPQEVASCLKNFKTRLSHEQGSAKVIAVCNKLSGKEKKLCMQVKEKTFDTCSSINESCLDDFNAQWRKTDASWQQVHTACKNSKDEETCLDLADKDFIECVKKGNTEDNCKRKFDQDYALQNLAK